MKIIVKIKNGCYKLKSLLKVTVACVRMLYACTQVRIVVLGICTPLRALTHKFDQSGMRFAPYGRTQERPFCLTCLLIIRCVIIYKQQEAIISFPCGIKIFYFYFSNSMSCILLASISDSPIYHFKYINIPNWRTRIHFDPTKIVRGSHLNLSLKMICCNVVFPTILYMNENWYRIYKNIF